MDTGGFPEGILRIPRECEQHVSSHLCKILAWISIVSETVAAAVFLAACGMVGTVGADRAYDLGTGYCDTKEKYFCCDRYFGKFSLHEACAGTGISDYVSMLDPDTSGSGIYAVTP